MVSPSNLSLGTRVHLFVSEGIVGPLINETQTCDWWFEKWPQTGELA